MITKFGKELSVLIITEPGYDWQAFASWYSVYKNIPDATIAIVSLRNNETPFQLFQWAKRLKLSLFHMQSLFNDPIAKKLNAVKEAKKRNLITENVLVISHLTMILEPFDANTLEILNKKTKLSSNCLYLQNENIDNMLNDILLSNDTYNLEEFCFEAKETECLSSIISYQKGCGKWIHTLKGCPFSNAAGLVNTNMTVNEIRIIDLWKRMCQLYSAVT